MVPSLRDGDRVVVWLRRRPRRTPKVGRVVVVDLPERPLSIKRLAEVYADGRVGVAGDNPYGSTDSREIGSLPARSVRGVALARLWPHPGPIPRPR
jgi:signal peptidase I